MKWISDGVVLTCVRDRRAAVTAKQEKEKKMERVHLHGTLPAVCQGDGVFFFLRFSREERDVYLGNNGTI